MSRSTVVANPVQRWSVTNVFLSLEINGAALIKCDSTFIERSCSVEFPMLVYIHLLLNLQIATDALSVGTGIPTGHCSIVIKNRVQ